MPRRHSKTEPSLNGTPYECGNNEEESRDDYFENNNNDDNKEEENAASEDDSLKNSDGATVTEARATRNDQQRDDNDDIIDDEDYAKAIAHVDDSSSGNDDTMSYYPTTGTLDFAFDNSLGASAASAPLRTSASLSPLAVPSAPSLTNEEVRDVEHRFTKAPPAYSPQESWAIRRVTTSMFLPMPPPLSNEISEVEMITHDNTERRIPPGAYPVPGPGRGTSADYTTPRLNQPEPDMMAQILSYLRRLAGTDVATGTVVTTGTEVASAYPVAEGVTEEGEATVCSVTCKFSRSSNKKWILRRIAIILILVGIIAMGIVLVRRGTKEVSRTVGIDLPPTIPPVAPPATIDGQNSSKPDVWPIELAEYGWIPGRFFIQGTSAVLSKDGSTLGFFSNGEISVYRIRDSGDLERKGQWASFDPDHTGAKKYEGGLALSRNGMRLATRVESADGFSVAVFELSVDESSRDASFWQPLGSDILVGKGDASFGRVIAMSSDGSIVAIAAPQNDTNGPDAGAVSVFRLQLEEQRSSEEQSRQEWTPMGRDLLGKEGDQFGTDLSLSRDGLIMAVGATQVPLNGTGEVRVFTWDPNTEQWRRAGDFISGRDTLEEFGFSLSLSASGHKLAVGAPYRPGGGQVQFWEWSEDSGFYEPFENTLSGGTVDLSDDGKTCVIELMDRTEETNAHCPNCGQVVIYQYAANSCRPVRRYQQTEARSELDSHRPWKVGISGDATVFLTSSTDGDSDGVRLYFANEWEQLGDDLWGSKALDGYGISLWLSSNGSHMAIGTGFADTENGVDSGYVEVYELQYGQWKRKGGRIEGEKGALYGSGIGLSDDGSILFVGQKKGVQILRHGDHESDWTLIDELRLPFEGAPNSKVGTAVAVSHDGSFLAAGAWSDGVRGNWMGSLTVYKRESKKSTSWIPVGFPITGRESREGFGSSIAISPDGQTVAGAFGVTDENVRVPGGSVRVFRYDEDADGKWKQIGQVLEGFPLEAPYSLLKLALNADGTVLAVGTYVLDPGHDHNDGTVRVYKLGSDGIDEWKQLGNDISGFSVSLRGTGFGVILAVGVPFHDIAMERCQDSGMIRVLKWEDSQNDWQQIGYDIVGQDFRETLGSSLSVSKNGTILAASGTLASHGGIPHVGMVRVFKRNSLEWR